MKKKLVETTLFKVSNYRLASSNSGFKDFLNFEKYLTRAVARVDD